MLAALFGFPANSWLQLPRAPELFALQPASGTSWIAVSPDGARLRIGRARDVSVRREVGGASWHHNSCAEEREKCFEPRISILQPLVFEPLRQLIECRLPLHGIPDLCGVQYSRQPAVR